MKKPTVFYIVRGLLLCHITLRRWGVALSTMWIIEVFALLQEARKLLKSSASAREGRVLISAPS